MHALWERLRPNMSIQLLGRHHHPLHKPPRLFSDHRIKSRYERLRPNNLVQIPSKLSERRSHVHQRHATLPAHPIVDVRRMVGARYQLLYMSCICGVYAHISAQNTSCGRSEYTPDCFSMRSTAMSTSFSKMMCFPSTWT